MKRVAGVGVVCFCLLTVSGCSPSQAEIEARLKANEAACLKEIAELQADKNMLVPDWWRKEYSYSATFLAGDREAGKGGVVWNNLLWLMLGLHLLPGLLAR